MGIFGSFTGGTPTSTLQFNQGLLPNQVVPSSTAFNPTPILNTYFQPYPYAADSLVTSDMIALTGGGTPLIASYPTLSPFVNSFMNMFNPAVTTNQATTTGGTLLNSILNPLGGAGTTQTNAGQGALSGLGGLSGLTNLLAGLGL